jgi:hypothetical protein
MFDRIIAGAPTAAGGSASPRGGFPGSPHNEDPHLRRKFADLVEEPSPSTVRAESRPRGC